MYSKIIILFFICSLSSLLVHAQVVNVEKERSVDTSKHLQGAIDLGVSITKNNSTITQVENKIQLQYFKNRNMFMFLNELSLVRVDSNSYLNDGFVHLRYNRELYRKLLIGEVFTQYQYNGAQNLNYRFLAGAGPRFRFVESDSLKFYFGPLFMYEKEERTDSVSTNKFRMSTYVLAHVRFFKTMSFGTIFYYQPNISDFSDYRLTGEATLKVKANKHFAIKVIFKLSFNPDPPVGIEELNYELKNALSISF